MVNDLKAADKLAATAQVVLLEVVRTSLPGELHPPMADLWRALRHYQRRRYRSRTVMEEEK